MTFRFLIPPLLILAPVVAAADTAVVADCVATLTDGQRLIYDTVLQGYDPAADLQPQVRAATVALVSAGQIPMRTAPQDAQIAADCLHQTVASDGE